MEWIVKLSTILWLQAVLVLLPMLLVGCKPADQWASSSSQARICGLQTNGGRLQS
jgi:hypothetical protein